MSVLDDQVSIPPRSNIVIPVGTETPVDVEGVTAGDQRLLLDREICVARGIAQFRIGKAQVMLINFSKKLERIKKPTTITYIEEIV